MFEKGKSGNPAGRPKDTHNIKTLARQYTKEALAALVDIMLHGDKEQARVAAACAILDRGFGRPHQSVEISGETIRYVVKVPIPASTPQEWVENYQPQKITQ